MPGENIYPAWILAARARTPPKSKAPKPEAGARPFVCANCNKSFKTANELGKHRKRSEKCISSRGGQKEEYRLTMEMIKALGAEGPFVFPERLRLSLRLRGRKLKKEKMCCGGRRIWIVEGPQN